MTKVKKILSWLLLIILVIGIIAVVWTNDQLSMMYGGKVPLVAVEKYEPVGGEIAIVHANILTEQADSFLTNRTLMIKDGQISKISQDSIFEDHIHVVDGRGKYIIPGLIDTHVHLFQSKNDLLIYLANGITTVREMMGTSTHLDWRNEIDEGRLGPDLIVASTKLQSYDRMQGLFMKWTQGHVNLNTSKDITQEIIQIEEEGYDAIKIGSFVNKEHYTALMSASDKVDIPIVGHIPFSITLDDFWEANQKETAHIEELVKQVFNEYRAADLEEEKDVLDYFLERAHPIALKLKEKDIAVVSTLWLMESLPLQKLKLDSLLSEVALEYVNPGIIEGTIMTSRALGWLPYVNLYRLDEGLTNEQIEGQMSYWNDYLAGHHIILRSLIDHEVSILAGTDANLPVVVPGFSLHQELSLLVDLGMSPNDAIRSATSAPSKRLHLNAGKIIPSFDADLVILNQNPLLDISNTKDIHAVMSNGKLLTDELLISMKTDVLAVNDEYRKVQIRN